MGVLFWYLKRVTTGQLVQHHANVLTHVEPIVSFVLRNSVLNLVNDLLTVDNDVMALFEGEVLGIFQLGNGLKWNSFRF